MRAPIEDPALDEDRAFSFGGATAPVERLRFEWPLAAPRDPLWKQALEADAADGSSGDLSDAWRRVVGGRLRPLCEGIGLERIYLFASADVASLEPCGPKPIEATVAARILCGDSRKAVAADLGIAPSAVSGHFRAALDGFTAGAGATPLPLVLAAQTWAGVVQVGQGRGATFEFQGRRCLVVSVPRPVTAGVDCWTHAERGVAQLLIEGLSRQEIARHRSTSTATVSRQVHSLFSAAKVTGRYALIRRAGELGCFGKSLNR